MQQSAPSRSDLSLPEELLLLTHDPQTGAPLAARWEYAVAGTILFELVLRGRIRIDGEQVRAVAQPTREPSGDDLLDEALKRIARARIKHTARWWVGVLMAGRPRLAEAYRQRMARQGILLREEYTRFRIFRRERFVLRDRAARDSTRDHLRSTVLHFHDGAEPVALDGRAMLLLPVVHALGLEHVLFSEQELREVGDSIERLAGGSIAGNLLRDVVGDSGLDSAALIVLLSATTDASDADGDGSDGGDGD
jgi:hypothetical protein